jgi:basic amino acid/polyamine antiporter, APA family
MAASLPLDTLLRLVTWAVVGIVLYYTYGRHHSRLRAGRGPRDS